MKEEIRQRKSTTEIIQNNPLIGISEIRNYPSIEKYLTERIEPKHNIIIQGVSYLQLSDQKTKIFFFFSLIFDELLKTNLVVFIFGVVIRHFFLTLNKLK